MKRSPAARDEGQGKAALGHAPPEALKGPQSPAGDAVEVRWADEGGGRPWGLVGPPQAVRPTNSEEAKPQGASRALDAGHAGEDRSGLKFSLPDPNDPRPSLTTLEGCEAAVREFVVKVVGLRGDYLEHPAQWPPERVKTSLTELANEARDTFYGRTQAYQTTAWNSPQELGAYLPERVRISGDPEAVLRAFFIQLAGRVINLAVEHEAGSLDDGQARFGLDIVVEEAVYALMGLPSPEAD